MQNRTDDETIDVLSDALRKARLRNSEKLAAIQRLQSLAGPPGLDRLSPKKQRHPAATYFPQGVAPLVSSALRCFTSVFGMGTGGPTSL